MYITVGRGERIFFGGGGLKFFLREKGEMVKICMRRKYLYKYIQIRHDLHNLFFTPEIQKSVNLWSPFVFSLLC